MNSQKRPSIGLPKPFNQSRPRTILYGDQDELDRHRRRTRPWFKPRWNPEMFFAQDFISAAVAMKKSVAAETLEARGGTERLDLDELDASCHLST